MMTDTEWSALLIRCGVKPYTAAKWAPVFAEVIGDDTFSKGNSELDDFLGQILHESSRLERMEEGLNYSADRLCQVWPHRFPDRATALVYAHNPDRLANFVYGGRLGNDTVNDGWRYRGSGLIQCTGEDNFRHVGEAIGIDLVANPDMLRTDPATALRASIAWWEGNIPDSVMGDIVKVTKRVNGGTVGLDDRRHITDEARKALG